MRRNSMLQLSSHPCTIKNLQRIKKLNQTLLFYHGSTTSDWRIAITTED